MSLLSHQGRNIGYDAAMGLTGLTAVLPVGDDLHDPGLELPGRARVPDGLRALGLKAHLWAADDPVPLSDALRPAIDAGFAVPAFGWPEPGDGWAVVTGYDLGRGVLCGWPARSDLETYLGAPPAGSAAVLCLEAREPLGRSEAAQEALAWAGEQGPELHAAYERWAGMVDARWAEDPEHPASLDRVLRHERLTEGLADARSAAASFYRRCADILDALPSQWLLAAADLCDQLVACVESRQPPLFSNKMPKALATEAWREQWRRQIADLATLDLRIAWHVGKAQTANFAPDELSAM